MKEFLRTLVASVVGTLIAAFLIYGMIVAGLAGAAAPRMPARAILVLGPELEVNDAGGAPALADLAQGAVLPTPLRTLVDALDAAAADARIAGILLHEGGPRVADWAQLRELRGALQRCSDAGKRVWAHAAAWDESGWYLASVADRLTIAPIGTFACDGFAAQMFYFGAALRKLGVVVQATRAGRYKSAVEPFTLDRSSPENDEQMLALLADVETMVFDACETARRLEPGALRAFAAEVGACSGEEAVRRGFLDAVVGFDAVLEELQEAAGAEDGGSFRQIHARDWLALADLERKGEVTVAVVYAVGDIVDGESVLDAGGATVARELRARRLDPQVDAVVLRVNSPGGSAAASEVIRREVELLRAAGKPVVASMGGVAASGGYWISCSATRILAEPATVTGSIGVLTLLPDVSPLLDRFGVHVSTVRTAPHADALDPFRARDAAEMERVQHFVDEIYAGFLDRVAHGRNLPRERVQELAEGRVWSGRAAREHGLVDALGSLGDAIRAAAELAGAHDGRYRVLGGERSPSAVDQLLEDVLQGRPDPVATLPASLRDLIAAAERQAAGLLTQPAPALARLPFNFSVR